MQLSYNLFIEGFEWSYEVNASVQTLYLLQLVASW